jgi:hypothetical protein
LKRAPFLGAAAATFLAGCGGHNVMRALPGVAPSSLLKPTAGKNGPVVPVTADPIPANVLTSPFIGEARRFDGAVAPAGWVLAQGQTVNILDNKQLFSILGTSSGGDGRSAFKLPNPRFGFIVAVAGVYPTSPQLLAQSGRRMTHTDSLGPDARAAVPPMPKPPSAKLMADRRLLTSGVRVGRSLPTRVSPELAQRITNAQQDARSAAIQALSPENRARLESAVQGAVEGRISVYGAVSQMIPALTYGEAAALLRVSDAMIQPFNDRAATSASTNAQIDAAHYLISVAFTPDQVRAIARHERY